MKIDAPLVTTAPPTLFGTNDSFGTAKRVDAVVVTSTLADTTALAAYAGAVTRILLPDGRTYQRVTSSATVDGVLVIAVAGSSTDRWQIVYDGKPLPVQFWGVTGNGTTDDTATINAAISSGAPSICFPKTAAFYKITNLITVSNLNTKRIFADGATILNTDLTKQSFLFVDCTNVSIFTGLWGYQTMPTANSGNTQHIFQFHRCVNTLLNGVILDKSGEMGVAFTNCNGYRVTKCKISHTMRDGVYSRYCANGEVVFSNFSNIKDDAISFHDKDNFNAGVDAEKTNTLVNVYGYSQATNFIAAYNTIDTVYQAVGSVGGANVEVNSNIISNTVLSAICLYNQNNADPAGILNANVHGNKITNACATVTINGTSYSNNGQSGAGRAAIFIGSTGTNNQVNQGETKRLTNVRVSENTIYSSGACGLWGNLIDGFQLNNNKFINCSGANAGQSLSGIPVEMQYITFLQAVNNTVNDTRSTVQHVWGYKTFNVTGYSETWNVNGFITAKSLILASTLNNTITDNNIQIKQADLSSNTANFDTVLTPGYYLVSGNGGWTGSTNPPASSQSRGNLEVIQTTDIVTQRYTDYQGLTTTRVLSSLSSGSWSSWMYALNTAGAYAVRYNAQPGTTYTLQESDNGKLIILTNGAAITLTLAPGLSAGWNAVIEQGGAGQVTWANGSGVTSNVYPSGTKTAAIRARVTVEHRGSNVFYLNGQMA